MKAESNIKPSKKMVIENIEGYTTIGLIDMDSIIEEERGGETFYKYDYYEIKMEKREIDEKDYSRLLKSAKNAEYNRLAKDIRNKRDILLADTDWTMMSDVSMETEKRKKYADYRQSLRDITEQEGFPYIVEFPILEV